MLDEITINKHKLTKVWLKEKHNVLKMQRVLFQNSLGVGVFKTSNNFSPQIDIKTQLSVVYGISLGINAMYGSVPLNYEMKTFDNLPPSQVKEEKDFFGVGINLGYQFYHPTISSTIYTDLGLTFSGDVNLYSVKIGFSPELLSFFSIEGGFNFYEVTSTAKMFNAFGDAPSTSSYFNFNGFYIGIRLNQPFNF